MNGVGIVIVTYNSRAEIGACLDATTGRADEIVVVDNASTDGTAEEATRWGVRVIANSTNRGFAAAVNQGFIVLKSPFVLLLNPDAVLLTDVAPLRKACEQPDAAGAGGRMLNPDGSPQTGFMARNLPTPAALILEALLLNRVWPKNPVNRRYRNLALDDSIPAKVEQPAGAFLMIRRDVWQALGGFDEEFQPLWFEDVDFCRRAIDRGYHMYFTPNAVVKHTGGHSIPRLQVETRLFYWYRSLLRYTAKHFGPLWFRAMCLAVITGSLLRVAAKSVSRRSLNPMAEYGKVLRFASRCFLSGWRDGSWEPGSGSL